MCRCHLSICNSALLLDTLRIGISHPPLSSSLPKTPTGFDNEGGFGSQNTPSRGGSSDGKPRRDYDAQTLIPVTIKMILDAYATPGAAGGSGDLQLKDERPIHMVKVVVAVRSHEERSTNLFLDIEDGTGFTQAKVWVNEGDECSGVVQLRQNACKDHQYVRIIGQVREFDGTRQIVANDVRPVSSGDEITYHFLEVAHSYEKHMKRQQQGGGMGIGGAMGYGIGNMASAPPQQGGLGISAQSGGIMGGGSALNDAVLAFIQGAGSECDCCIILMYCVI